MIIISKQYISGYDVRGDKYGNTIYEGEVCIHEPDNPNPEYLKAYINNPKALERFKKSGAKNLSKLLADQLEATSSPSATKAFVAKYGRQPNLFGERVKYLRERIHKTQEDIYTAVGISKSTMIRIENGSSVKEDTAVKIIEQLTCDISTFAYFPNDFEFWKMALEEDENYHNIYAFLKASIADYKECQFVYKVNGVQKQFPPHYSKIIVNLLQSALDIANTIEHDDDDTVDFDMDIPSFEEDYDIISAMMP